MMQNNLLQIKSLFPRAAPVWCSGIVLRMGELARHIYRERRNATYYARLDVPLDPVKHFGTMTGEKSLRTKDENEAKKRLWPVIEGWRADFEEVRARREITPDDKAIAVWQHYEATIDGYGRTQRSLPTPKQMDAELQQIYRRIDMGEIT